jgi:hypothetical protein
MLEGKQYYSVSRNVRRWRDYHLQISIKGIHIHKCGFKERERSCSEIRTRKVTETKVTAKENGVATVILHIVKFVNTHTQTQTHI